MKNRYFLGVLTVLTMLTYRAGLWTRDSLQHISEAPKSSFRPVETQRFTRQFRELEKNIQTKTPQSDHAQILLESMATQQLQILKTISKNTNAFDETLFEFHNSILQSPASWVVRRQAFKNLLPYMTQLPEASRWQLLSQTDPLILHTAHLSDKELITFLINPNAD